MKKHLFPLIYGILLVAFTGFVLLDTFVIPRVETQVVTQPRKEPTAYTEPEYTEPEYTEETDPEEEEIPTEPEETEEPTQTEPAYTADDYYEDDNIAIYLKEYVEHDTVIYVADVYLSSPEYLQTAFAQDAFGRNITEKTSDIAERHGAILAINGDYYGAQEEGYVVRGGVVYRDSAREDQEALLICADGSFDVADEEDYTVQELMDYGAVEILSFGPALVYDGEICVRHGEEVGKAMASNPRTAIGMVEPLHYLLVVADGRTEESEGLSLYELAEFMESLGAEIAYNLDGGGSSTMYWMGEVVNNPTTDGRRVKERSVSDIVYIGY